MNIKKAEELSGVSRQNIRYYEREGLLRPERNAGNDYREYGEEHIHALKQIRAMRMLDMPLDQIRQVLSGELTPAEAAAGQKRKLLDQQAKLDAAIRFCEEWTALQCLEDLDIDAVLRRMEQPENARGLLQQWKEDYRKVALSESQKLFTFIPEDAVTNPREFTAALMACAEKENMDMVITKESMYPEFTVNGIEYEAERVYTVVNRVPVAVIRCTVKHLEDFEPDVPPKRKLWMKLLNHGWGIYGLLILCCAAGLWYMLSSWEGWVLLLCLGIFGFVWIYRMQLLHFNEKQ